MSDVAIQTSELGKSYNLGLSRRGYGTLRESVVETAQGLAGTAGRRGAASSPRATRSGPCATSR